jgi:NADPH-dependent curcumin reductase CurA
MIRTDSIHTTNVSSCTKSKTMFISSGAGLVGMFFIEYMKVLAPHVKVVPFAGSAAKAKIMKDCGTDVA